VRYWLLFYIAVVLCSCHTAIAQSTPAVQLTLDTSEAEQALRILDKQAAHQSITSDDWQRLFATVPYQWLKARETSVGRAFTDGDFEHYLLSPETLARRSEWEETLAVLKQANMTALGTGVLAWLPPGAVIHARVFPEIKPVHNSFVWSKKGEGPAIFLYLERQSSNKFENTVAHECHHIGLESLDKQEEAIQAGLPPNVKRALNWMTAFGEGSGAASANARSGISSSSSASQKAGSGRVAAHPCARREAGRVCVGCE